jgi:hypothetical protein
MDAAVNIQSQYIGHYHTWIEVKPHLQIEIQKLAITGVALYVERRRVEIFAG